MAAEGKARLAGAAAAIAALLGCVDVPRLADEPCPEEGTELTYEGFGRPFLDDHCQSCHAGATSDRKGAPSAYAFDTPEDVGRWAERIYVRAAATTTMPPGPEGPSAEERALLAEWLACGAP